jgi:hypothetical protein
MSEDERRRKAREIAVLRLWFRVHLIIYIVVNAGLVGLWYYDGAGYPWPLISIVFWGIGLIAHYLLAYRRIGGDWINRETEKVLRDSDL